VTFLKIAVVSDFHAFDASKLEAAPSHLDMSLSSEDPARNPLAALKRLIGGPPRLSADLLLCPGDLGHQAHPEALRFGWQALTSLVPDLGSPRLAATSGNHDVDSRYVYNKFDAKGVLQELVPAYPLLEEQLCDRYWSRNFAIIEEGSYRLVVLNSAAYHGSSTDGTHEYVHGRVADATLRRLAAELERSGVAAVNILLCHHHPQQHDELDRNEYDVMSGGQRLLDLLGSGRFGRWIVVHGHKHHPKLSYAQGSSASAVVLSAGSLCATLFPALQTNARNQFHLIEIPIAEVDSLGLVGVVRSWDWAVGKGWALSGAGAGLPGICGFGNRTDPALIAAKVQQIYEGGVKSWEEMQNEEPHLRFLLPADVGILRDELRRRFNLQLLESDGRIVEVGECF
jgi:predicted phosphodiesterase